jgi:dTDP-D-glucose 4,6-dehydratase
MKCGQPQPPGTLRDIYIYIYIYTHTHAIVYVLKKGSVREKFKLYQAFRYTNNHSYVFTNISHIILSFVKEIRNAYKRFDLKLL